MKALKTIKLINFLDDVANGIMPKNIKYKGVFYTLTNRKSVCYRDNEQQLLEKKLELQRLNDTIEIVEDYDELASRIAKVLDYIDNPNDFESHKEIRYIKGILKGEE